MCLRVCVPAAPGVCACSCFTFTAAPIGQRMPFFFFNVFPHSIHSFPRGKGSWSWREHGGWGASNREAGKGRESGGCAVPAWPVMDRTGMLENWSSAHGEESQRRSYASHSLLPPSCPQDLGFAPGPAMGKMSVEVSSLKHFRGYWMK